VSEAALPAHTDASRGALPPWERLMGIYVGIIPLPVYGLLVAVVAGILLSGPVPTEMAMVLAIMLVGSFTLAEIGNRLPYVRNIGAAALFVTFIPSALVYYGLLPANVTKVVSDFFKSTNIMYMFIAIVTVVISELAFFSFAGWPSLASIVSWREFLGKQIEFRAILSDESSLWVVEGRCRDTPVLTARLFD